MFASKRQLKCAVNLARADEICASCACLVHGDCDNSIDVAITFSPVSPLLECILEICSVSGEIVPKYLSQTLALRKRCVFFHLMLPFLQDFFSTLQYLPSCWWYGHYWFAVMLAVSVFYVRHMDMPQK